MKRTLLLSLILCAVVSLLIGIAVIGARRPEPYRTTYLGWLFVGNTCELPCWRGIIPGKTGIREAADRLAKMPDIRDLTFQNETLVFQIETARGNLYSWMQYYYSDPVVHGIHFEVTSSAVPMADMILRFVVSPGLNEHWSILALGNNAALSVLLYRGTGSGPIRLPCTPFRKLRRVSLTRDGLIFSMEVDLRLKDYQPRSCLYQ